MKKDLLVFVVFLVLCFSAALVGNVATRTSVDGWFQTLNKPPLDPPRWLFPPVWTMIYLLMAAAGFFLWQERDGQEILLPMTAYGIQLVLNACWSVVFFGLQKPGWAFLELCFLWAAAVAFLLLAWPIRRLASWLFVPYVLWLTYAGYLNVMIWWLNR